MSLDWVLINRAWLVACCLLAALTSCATLQPKAGDNCLEGDAVCHRSGALVCRAGQYVFTSCSGPQGCSTVKGDSLVSCDQTAGAQGGELCLPPYEGQVQCYGPSAYLRCTGGKWTPGQCGSGLCQARNGNVVCE